MNSQRAQRFVLTTDKTDHLKLVTRNPKLNSSFTHSLNNSFTLSSIHAFTHYSIHSFIFLSFTLPRHSSLKIACSPEKFGALHFNY